MKLKMVNIFQICMIVSCRFFFASDDAKYAAILLHDVHIPAIKLKLHATANKNEKMVLGGLKTRAEALARKSYTLQSVVEEVHWCIEKYATDCNDQLHHEIALAHIRSYLQDLKI